MWVQRKHAHQCVRAARRQLFHVKFVPSTLALHAEPFYWLPCWRRCCHPLQVGDDANVMLNGFGTVVNALGKRAKPYLPQICGTIKWRLNNKAAKIRQQAADLIARIAPVLKACEEEQLLGHLGVVLYEYLGEEVSSGGWGNWHHCSCEDRR